MLETTGLSDDPLLSALERSEAEVLVVRLDVSEEEAIRRVTGRPHGRHLSDEAELNRDVCAAFQEHVAPRRHVDLVVDTDAESVDSAVAAIASAIID